MAAGGTILTSFAYFAGLRGRVGIIAAILHSRRDHCIARCHLLHGAGCHGYDYTRDTLERDRETE